MLRATAEATALKYYEKDLERSIPLSPDEIRIVFQRLESARIEAWTSLHCFPEVNEKFLRLLIEYLASEHPPRIFQQTKKGVSLAPPKDLIQRRLTLAQTLNERLWRLAQKEAVTNDDLRSIATKLRWIFGTMRLHWHLFRDWRESYARLLSQKTDPSLNGQTPHRVLGLPQGLAKRLSIDLLGHRRQIHSLYEDIAAANLKLVVKIANVYVTPMDPMDVIAEGNQGLIEAIDRYDFQFGHRFSTYAVSWIRQRIIRAMKAQRLVRVKSSFNRVVHQIREATAEMRNLDIPPPYSAALIADWTGLELQHVEIGLQSMISIVSLDQPMGNGEGDELSTVIRDDHSEATDASARINLLRTLLEIDLKRLTEREALVLSLRFGWNGPSQTLEEIGERLHLTRERVRQIENKALRKLRKPQTLRKYREILSITS